jgi:two-component system cell cycle response regulator
MLPSILLVDDDEDILDFLERILKNNYGIFKAQDGQEALYILEIEAVQLIISDVMMPVLDGFELCKIVKSSFEYSHIPVILLTAKNTLPSKIEGLDLGADAYIEKPFSKVYLEAQIANLLNNRSIIRDYFANSPLVNIKSISHSKTDELFLEKLHKTILSNIEYEDLDVEKLAGIMCMSRITLYRKIKSISDLTPVELINITRLKKAAELLAQGEHRINEVSVLVGFSSQSNFARNFQKQFCCTPTEFMISKKMGNI